MGDERTERSSWGFFEYIPFVLGGGIAAYGLYVLLRKKDIDITAALAPTKAPSTYADFGAVLNRFNQVKELWRMGYIESPQVISELNTLENEALLKAANGQTTREEADALLSKMQLFLVDVGENVIASGAIGVGYRVVKRKG